MKFSLGLVAVVGNKHIFRVRGPLKRVARSRPDLGWSAVRITLEVMVVIQIAFA